jgi:hypothetical protein
LERVDRAVRDDLIPHAVSCNLVCRPMVVIRTATARTKGPRQAAGSTNERARAHRLGSVRLVEDVSTGQVAQRIDFDAFGRVSKNTNPGLQPFGFAGGLLDGTRILVRFWARDFDPIMHGRSYRLRGGHAAPAAATGAADEASTDASPSHAAQAGSVKSPELCKLGAQSPASARAAPVRPRKGAPVALVAGNALPPELD